MDEAGDPGEDGSRSGNDESAIGTGVYRRAGRECKAPKRSLERSRAFSDRRYRMAFRRFSIYVVSPFARMR
jgi:hypothetical protein